MALSMPDPGPLFHLMSVNYAASFGSLTTQQGLVSFSVSTPVQFSFTFETGRTQPDPSVDLWNVSWDYSWFSQADVEQSIAGALDSICQTLASLLNLPATQVQGSVTVQRVWTVAANTQGSAAAEQFGDTAMDGVFTIAEIMPYTPAGS